MLELPFWGEGAGFVVSQIPLIVIAGVMVGIVILPFALRLHRILGARRLYQYGLSVLLIVIGTIPPTVLGLLWYARRTDYLWAIHGPFPFNYVGSGGPVWMWAFLWTVAFTAACWGAAAWLEIGSRRGRGER